MAPLGDPPPKPIFWTTLFTVLVFFDISSSYFGDEYFGIVWGATPPPRNPPKQTPQKSVFWLPQTRAIVFFSNISPYLRDEYFDIIWEYLPPWDPPKWTLQILIFSLAQTRALVLYFDINRYNRQIFWHSLRVPPHWGAPQSGPPKIKFLHHQTYDACVF